MELRQIQYFICLFEEGTVTGAARRVNVVQPALSAQIAKLEEELGQKLFVRNPRGMEPTEAGRRMYQLYLPILRDLTHAREQMTLRRDEVGGEVAVGMISSLAESVLSEALTEFARRYPKVNVTVTNGPLLDWVAAGKIDAAIVDKPRRPFSLSVEPILDDELVLVGPDDPAVPDTLPLAAAAALPLVFTPREHNMREILEDYARQENVVFKPAFEIYSMTALLNLAQDAGLYAILPRTVVRRHAGRPSLRVRSIGAPAMFRQIIGVTHPRRPLTTAAALLLEVLKRHIRGLSG
ncbi:HTH-type transcriptional regulator CynR [Pigmentiphaga humi]|uniref:HTH-type transcriptional regulator CynR n=1 Tax=Pigmentiphaga humi TaxID=2478468 RepID=A0A3P4AW79_9BURK|nr:LysR family transcriptional regulator [Pigmentiphaga humi]VCU68304.1 HTH-type transcriptional regulator CynR [Pigmentiphaga humi]